MESENDLIAAVVNAAGADDGPSVSTATAVKRGKLAYFALELPHKGQASYVHIHEIVDNLRQLGWQVDLFTPRPGLPGQRRNIVAKAFEYIRATWNALASIAGYDVIYVRNHPLTWAFAVVASIRGFVVVEEVNGTELDPIASHPWLAPARPLLRWLHASQYRRARHLFPVAKELAAWVRLLARHDRITVVPNGANTDLFRPIDAGGGAAPFVVFFGGLTAWHGVDVMIEATRHPSWPRGLELVVIGAGGRQNLIEEAVRAGLPIRWLGYRPYEQIPGLLAGAIAGLIPMTNPRGRSSTSTGMNPLKLYETLACGIPVIVSDLPGQAEFVAEGRCGLVVPCGDAAALARAVAQLAADPAQAREMGQRGAALVRAAHSWHARAVVIDKVLCECLAGAAQ